MSTGKKKGHAPLAILVLLRLFLVGRLDGTVKETVERARVAFFLSIDELTVTWTRMCKCC